MKRKPQTMYRKKKQNYENRQKRGPQREKENKEKKEKKQDKETGKEREKKTGQREGKRKETRRIWGQNKNPKRFQIHDTFPGGWSGR